MKLKITFLAVLMITGGLFAHAQTKKITDDELVRYAVASDSLKKITERFNQANLKASNDPKIAAARQQQLIQAQGDSLKLAQLKATPYEKAYLKKVRDNRYKESSKFRDTYASLINDYVGSDLYTRITAESRTDKKLKHKLDSISATLIKKKP